MWCNIKLWNYLKCMLILLNHFDNNDDDEMFWRIVDWPNWVKPEVLTLQTSKPINSFQHFLELYLIFAFPSELTTSYLKNVQRGFILLLLTNFCRKVTMNMTGPPQIECYIKLSLTAWKPHLSYCDFIYQ